MPIVRVQVPAGLFNREITEYLIGEVNEAAAAAEQMPADPEKRLGLIVLWEELPAGAIRSNAVDPVGLAAPVFVWLFPPAGVLVDNHAARFVAQVQKPLQYRRHRAAHRHLGRHPGSPGRALGNRRGDQPAPRFRCPRRLRPPPAPRPDLNRIPLSEVASWSGSSWLPCRPRSVIPNSGREWRHAAAVAVRGRSLRREARCHHRRGSVVLPRATRAASWLRPGRW